MNDLIIRMARPDDAERLSDIYAYYVKNTAVSFEYEPPGTEEFRTRISSTLKKYPYLVAELCGFPVGYAYAGPLNMRAAARWVVESSVYVDKNMRRSGIGIRLYDALESILVRQNVVSMTAKVAYCEREDEYLSRDSVRFHSNCGFEIVGRHNLCGYKFGHWYDLLIMEKQIAPRITPMPEFVPIDELGKIELC